MTVSINLASQPFRRDRPVLIASVVLAVGLVGLLGALISLIVIQRAQVADTRKNIAQLQAQLGTLASGQTTMDAVLRKPENAEVLERSLFLNQLLYRKGISWTKIFGDLEKTVPHNVRIISIRPWVNAQNQITLDMLVGAEAPEAAIELLRQLETSPRFGAAYMHTSLPPTQTEPLYRYRVSVNYAQKLD